MPALIYVFRTYFGKKIFESYADAYILQSTHKLDIGEIWCSSTYCSQITLFN